MVTNRGFGSNAGGFVAGLFPVTIGGGRGKRLFQLSAGHVVGPLGAGLVAGSIFLLALCGLGSFERKRWNGNVPTIAEYIEQSHKAHPKEQHHAAQSRDLWQAGTSYRLRRVGRRPHTRDRCRDSLTADRPWRAALGYEASRYARSQRSPRGIGPSPPECS